ncbi:MAG: FAD-dependent oxidoreductase [Syntrophobacteraceae bacterium]|nr:FAD-dependent oxidoreductase [Syntrophobacteraceae bacterium]
MSAQRTSGRVEGLARKEVEDQLRTLFGALPRNVPIYLFTRRGENDVLNEAARDLIKAFRGLSSKIEFREFDLSHEMARKWGVTASPTLLFDPEHLSISYLGVPYGEESRTFMGTLILVGHREANLSDQARRVIEQIDSPRRIRVFVSPTCPYCPEQAIHAVKAALLLPQLISVEMIDIQANPDLASRYSAFSVPQTFANDILIGQGLQAEELFALSLQKLEPQTVFIPESTAEEVETDVVVVGGGPAGLTAGIYAVRSGLRTAVVEKGPLGGQIATTPIVENYPGFTRVAGKTLVDIMVSHALEYVQIFQGEEVLDLQPGAPGEKITVQTSRRRFITRAVILATGARHKHLSVPGEGELSGRGVSYCATCDGQLFTGKSVLIVGGGNTAATEALYLHNLGVRVTVVHRRGEMRAQDYLVRDLEDKKIPILYNTEVKAIRGREQVTEVDLINNQTGEVYPVPADGVFVAVGYEPTVDLARKIGVELTPDGFIKRDAHHRTNIPGIFAAGDVEGGYKQIVTAVGQGSEAALSVYEELMHPSWKESPLMAQTA